MKSDSHMTHCDPVLSCIEHQFLINFDKDAVIM